MTKRRVFVVVGGDLSPADVAMIDLDQDLIIAADGGAQKLLQLGIQPHLAVGDFDTTGDEFIEELRLREVQVKRLPAAKDVTDTHYAVSEALTYQPDEIILLGALGGSRFDHTLANLYLLEWMAQHGVSGVIVHPTNRIRLLVAPTEYILLKEEYSYISLLPLSEKVEGITTQGFLYPLYRETLHRSYTRGISNEVVEPEAKIWIETGTLLLIESKD